MILKYVLKNFARRKVRTILMILSLIVSTGLIVTMSATVETVRRSIIDLIASDVGRADISLSKKDTNTDLFMPIEETAALVQGSDGRIVATHPRIEIFIDTNLSTRQGGTVLIGLDSALDDVAPITMLEGEFKLGDGQVVLSKWISTELGLDVGDTFSVAYAFPIPREPGKMPSSGTSSVRLQRQFTVSGIANTDGVSQRPGILVELDEMQTWLNKPGQANQMLVVVDPRLYETNNSDAAALSVREIASHIQKQLGDAYEYDMYLASTLSDASQVFLALQALINTYGLISLGVVGLLVYTLVMTNVQEQRRDMAVLRILGSQRRLLFGLVIVEVLVIGLIGIGLGVILGHALTAYVLVPILTYFLNQEGLILKLAPQVSLTTIVPPVISAFTVLILSSLKPANDASKTKVIYAINPTVADNIQLEDLAQLRERRPDGKMFLVGTSMVFVFILITGFEALGAFGGEILQIVFVMLALFGMILGVSLMFFILTVPFERLVLAFMRLISPRLTYFARRNVGRGKTRNTLISLLVLFSAVLPSFLGTQAQLELANDENRSRMHMGAPLKIETYSRYYQGDEGPEPLKPSFVHRELAAVPGIDEMVGVSYPYDSWVHDLVGLRNAPVNIYGIDGDLNQVVFTEMMEFSAGGPESLRTIIGEPGTVIISEGLADYLAVDVGDEIELQGEGLDNMSKARVVGIARRIPGLPDITRSRIAARSRSSVFVSLSHFGQLSTTLDHTPPTPNDPLVEKVLATISSDAVPEDVAETIQEEYALQNNFWIDLLTWQLEQNQSDRVFFVALLLAMTGISFTTAVFAVFAVIYVTIYARRLEIGMLKSMGMLRSQLTGMLIVEAIAMTLGSALAGIVAGASMAYLNYYIDAVMSQMPTQFAVDTIATPAIIVMVVLASIMAAAFSARRIVRKSAVEILRMS